MDNEDLGNWISELQERVAELERQVAKLLEKQPPEM